MQVPDELFGATGASRGCSRDLKRWIALFRLRTGRCECSDRLSKRLWHGCSEFSKTHSATDGVEPRV